MRGRSSSARTSTSTDAPGTARSGSPTTCRKRLSPGETSYEDRDELITALQQLPPMQRNAVVLRHWLGLSTRDTAIELGISEGTVKSHTARGLERLSSLLDAEVR